MHTQDVGASHRKERWRSKHALGKLLYELRLIHTCSPKIRNRAVRHPRLKHSSFAPVQMLPLKTRGQYVRGIIIRFSVGVVVGGVG